MQGLVVREIGFLVNHACELGELIMVGKILETDISWRCPLPMSVGQEIHHRIRIWKDKN